MGCYYHLYDLSSIKKKSTFWRYALLIIVLLCFFSYGIHWLSLLLHFLQSSHMHCLFLSSPLFLYYCYWTVPLEMLYLLISKTLQFLLLLPPYFHSLSYTIPYYSIHQHLKFIMENRSSLFYLFLVSAVMDQMPKPFITKTLLFFSFLQFYP